MDLDKEIDFSKVTGKVKSFVRLLKEHDKIPHIITSPFAFLLGMSAAHKWVTKGDFTLEWCIVAGISTFIWFLIIVGISYIASKAAQKRVSKIHSNPFDC